MKKRALQLEIDLYEQRLPELLEEHEDKFVLMKGKNLDVFETEEEAVNAGWEKYGAGSGFLIRRILDKQPEVNIPALYHGLTNARI